MRETDYHGLLFIGDPHLEGRQPGYRKDDYPEVILRKLEWCLDYARQERLLPALLGDLFERPRDNPNWMIDRLLNMLQGEVLTLYGNHDVYQNPQLTPDDSLSLLVSSGRLTLLHPERPWCGRMQGQPVVVGGSSYRQEIPRDFDCSCHGASTALVVWLTHHDILIPGYDEGRIKPRAIPGVNYIINGHIHRHLEDVVQGATTWLTPGNISRRARSDMTRTHLPRVLELRVQASGHEWRRVDVPHQSFDDVFHAAMAAEPTATNVSAFVAGLAELQARKTDSGAALKDFLELNTQQFAPRVTAEILALADEVTHGEIA